MKYFKLQKHELMNRKIHLFKIVTINNKPLNKLSI